MLDDDEEVILSNKRLFEDSYAITTVQSSKEAIELLEKALT